MIMIRHKHVITIIGEKVHGHMHSAHKFVSIRGYCFAPYMLA